MFVGGREQVKDSVLVGAQNELLTQEFGVKLGISGTIITPLTNQVGCGWKEDMVGMMQMMGRMRQPMVQLANLHMFLQTPTPLG